MQTDHTDAELRAREALKSSKRVVVKVGTSTITHESGALNFVAMEHICRALANQMNKGREMVLVTSGAISVGMHRLRLTERPAELRQKQAIAAIGQCDLMHIYSRLLAEYDHICAQILMTRGDVDDPQSHFNIRNTFSALIERGVIPIVNENDSVSTKEVYFNGTFGDNDRLSAIVASIVKADALILLSDIDGLYDGDPRQKTDARLIPYVKGISAEIEASAGGSGTRRGTGGMSSKLRAAARAHEAGIPMIIANGAYPEHINRILDGEAIGTYFDPA